MKTRSVLGAVAITLIALATVSLPDASDDEMKVEELFGTGSRATSVVRVSETLGDCGDADSSTNIVVTTSQGTVTYTGIIEGMGRVFTKTIVDGCVPAGVPRPGSFKVRDTLEEVTIAGKTGGAVIETDGVVEQFLDADRRVIAAPTKGTRRILCGTGELKDVHGEGVTAGNSTATSAGGTYALWVHFGHKHDVGFDFLCQDLDDDDDSDD